MATTRAAVTGLVGVLLGVSGAWGQCAEPVRVREYDCLAGDRAGWAVGIDGDRMITGSIRDDGLGTDSGAAHVFVRGQDGKWKQEAKLNSAVGEPGDLAGSGVAIAGDDAFVGMPYAGFNGFVSRWRFEGGQWVEKEQLGSGVNEQDAKLGSAVATDGTWLFAGGPNGHGLHGDLSGEVSVYKKSGQDTWLFYQRAYDDEGLTGDKYGAAVAARGGVAAVGAPGWDEPGATDCGAVTMFKMGGIGPKILPPSPEAQAHFGQAVAVGDGWIAVGAPDSKVGQNEQAGAVYLFAVDGLQITYKQKLTNGGGTAYKKFGWAVAMAGERLFVAQANSGLVVPYTLGGNGVWTRGDDIVDPDSPANGHFGAAVATDGARLVVGDDYDDYVELNFADAGAAYVVELPSACAADTDGNGLLDLFDFLGFQNLFVAQDCRADLNGDGVYDFFDFLAYQNAFSAGCE